MMTISGTLPIQSQTVSVAMESLPQKQASAFKLPVSSDWYPGLRMRNLSYSSTGRRWIPPPQSCRGAAVCPTHTTSDELAMRREGQI